MAFVITLGFATKQDEEEFVERTLPKVRGHLVEPNVVPEDEDGLHRVGVAVTSQTAARDLCHILVSFLAHSKNDRVNVAWRNTEDEPQQGEVFGNSPRDAEIVSVRVGASAKAHLDREKADAEPQGKGAA